MTGQLSPNVWYFAQLGLVQVAYRAPPHQPSPQGLRRRQEGGVRAAQTTVMSQQYQGSAIDIVYPSRACARSSSTTSDWRSPTGWCCRSGCGPIRSRPSSAARRSCTSYTGEDEDAFDYICRNTLLRPRDLMTIGERLTALRPEERRNEHRLKEAVNRAATEIAHEYLTEIAPYVGDLELERFLRRLPGPFSRETTSRSCSASTTPTSGARETARVLRALSGRAPRPSPPRLGARGMGATVPAAGRGHARARRGAAASDALLRPSRAVRRDRPAESRLPSARRPGQHRRLRATVARRRQSGDRASPRACCVS